MSGFDRGILPRMARHLMVEVDRVREILGGPMMGTFNRAFAMMKVAEEEILGACRRHPDETKAIWNSFKALQPYDMDGAEELYRAHCRELLDRVAVGEDLGPGTRAEVCWMISKMSQASRLQRDVELLGLTIADAVFPGRGLLDGAREDYPGSLKEVEAEFRRKLRREDRKTREEMREPPPHFLAEL